MSCFLILMYTAFLAYILCKIISIDLPIDTLVNRLITSNDTDTLSFSFFIRSVVKHILTLPMASVTFQDMWVIQYYKLLDT